MIAVDTYVLVRFLVEDDARQSAAAVALVERAVRSDDSLYVSVIVLCETVWVLSVSYRVPRLDVVKTLQDLLRAKHLTFDDPDRLARAIDSFTTGRGDFADYLIREDALAAGCSSVVTFDRELLREAGFDRP
ncbi:MAG: PIN domain-containing protein [Gemmatimonadaceae bacterium]